MKRLLLVAASVGLAALTTWTCADRSAPAAGAIRGRTVAFDNLYGDVKQLPVQVKVDEGTEQALTATCDARTCRFELPLTNARHELLISVEHNGQRSAATKVTLDASTPPR